MATTVDNPRSSPDNVTAGQATTPIPDEDHGADLPLTMSASVVLTALPPDAHQALADAEAIDTGKGNCLFISYSFSRHLNQLLS
jgi:hypothetical protein